MATFSGYQGAGYQYDDLETGLPKTGAAYAPGVDFAAKTEKEIRLQFIRKVASRVEPGTMRHTQSAATGSVLSGFGDAFPAGVWHPVDAAGADDRRELPDSPP